MRAFLTHLAAERNVAASTQNQALSVILFLFQQTLEHDPGWVDGVERAKKPLRLPVVLTQEEARAVLGWMPEGHRLMAELLYGSGLRLMECPRLRIKDLDFGYLQINVRDARGARTFLSARRAGKPALL